MNNKINLLTHEEKNSFLDHAIERFNSEYLEPNKYICLEFSKWIESNISLIRFHTMSDDISIFPELYSVIKEEVIKSGGHPKGSTLLDIGVIRFTDNKYRRDLLIQLKIDINKVSGATIGRLQGLGT